MAEQTLGGGVDTSDDTALNFGTDNDYGLIYDSGNDRFEMVDQINSTDLVLLEKNGPFTITNSNLKIDGSNSIVDASGNQHLTINDGGNTVVNRTLQATSGFIQAYNESEASTNRLRVRSDDFNASWGIDIVADGNTAYMRVLNDSQSFQIRGPDYGEGLFQRVNLNDNGSIQLYAETGGGTVDMGINGGTTTMSVGSSISMENNLLNNVGAIRSNSASISDDATHEFIPTSDYGKIVVRNSSGAVAEFLFDVANGSITKIADLNTDFETSTSDLTGTTGTDGKVTVSADGTNGQIDIENRLGASHTFVWQISG